MKAAGVVNRARRGGEGYWKRDGMRGDYSVALTVLWHPQKAGSAVFEGS